jgi:biotin transport system substrate-specific component
MTTDALTTSRTRTRDLTVAALIAALIAGTSWISIPFGPVPVTLQTMLVLIAGLMLSPGWAAASMGLYLAIGAAGLPVFAGGQGGMAALAGPTGGFLIAFPIAAAAVSVVYRAAGGSDRGQARSIAAAAMAVVVGEVVVSAIGVPWLMVQTKMSLIQSLGLALVPFIIPDAVKAVFAVGLSQAVDRALGR